MIEIIIEKLNSSGLGVATYNSKNIYVPFSAIGDRLNVAIKSENSKFYTAEIVEVLSPSQDRILPICKHYTECGGCNLQHLDYGFYKSWKLNLANNAFENSGFAGLNIDFADFPDHSRRVVKVHNKNSKIGFYKQSSNEIIEINSCKTITKVLMDKINHLRNKSIKNKDIFLSDYDHVEYGKYKVKYDGSFVQASDLTNKIVSDYISPKLDSKMLLADLFAGSAAYTLYLHNLVQQVHAFEGNEKTKPKIDTLIKENQIINIGYYLRDLFKNPLDSKLLSKYNAIIINPPYNGAEPQFIELAKSNVKDIYVVSCNLESFSRDISYLNKSGYKIHKAILLDQFKYTNHIEIFAHFSL